MAGVRFSIGVHPHAAGKFDGEPGAAARAVGAAMDAQPLTRAWAKLAWTTTTTSRRGTCSRRSSAARLRLRATAPADRDSHARGGRRHIPDSATRSAPSRSAVVLHCFTGDRDTARRALDVGYYLSLAGIVTFPRALELKEVARLVPLDRLLIETDSPFLAPVPHRGKRNEPAHVVRVAEVIAELEGVTRR